MAKADSIRSAFNGDVQNIQLKAFQKAQDLHIFPFGLVASNNRWRVLNGAGKSQPCKGAA